MYDAVGIDHRHNFEHKIISQLEGTLVVAGQEVYDPLYDIAGHRFARMGPTSNEYPFFLSVVDEVGYGQDLNSVASQCPRQHSSVHDAPLRPFKPIQVAVELCVRIRVVVSKEDLVVLVTESIAERQGAVLLQSAVSDFFNCAIPKVVNVCAISMPPSPRVLLLFQAVDHDLHSLLEQGGFFVEIGQVKLILPAALGVLNLEEEPLGVPVSVDVALHEQVVLLFTPYLLGLLEISTLEVAFEAECLLLGRRQRLSRERLLLVEVVVPCFRYLSAVHYIASPLCNIWAIGSLLLQLFVFFGDVGKLGKLIEPPVVDAVEWGAGPVQERPCRPHHSDDYRLFILHDLL